MTDLYFGGVPYGPDIKKLRETYLEDKLRTGQEISYQEISDLIHEHPKSSRFYAVTRTWRKRVEKESGIFIQPTGSGDKFKVINESEKLELANREDRTAVKKSRRSLIVLKSIDDKQLTEEERSIHGFKLQKIGKVLAIQQIKKPQALPEMI